jgi:RNA polymerase sigma-70 factor (ECF subfamily)
MDEPEGWIIGIAERQDRSCFVALFTHFAPKVKGHLLSRGVREPVAEELTQETFLTIWRKAGQFDPDRASAAAWIYTIARNRRIDVLRREFPADDGRCGEQPPEPPTPEHELRTLEAERRVRMAVDGLPIEQATVLRLSYFEDLTHAEIASQLGLPLGTVKSRIRLASAHLRSTLDGWS